MASRIIAIADDVVTVINGGSFTYADPVAAIRWYVPDYDLAGIKTLRVSVLPADKPELLQSRNLTQRDFMISVGVQQKVSNLTTDFDDLVELVEEINALFRFAQLPVTGVSWIASEVDPVYDPDHASQMNVFTSVLNLTFRDFLKKS